MLLAAPLIDLPSAYRLMSAMPTGLNAMVVSHAYGLDNQIVAEAVTWSTAIVVAAALVSLAVLMLQHVGIEIEPGDVERAVEFFALLGFERVEPPPALRRRLHLARARRHPDPPDARGEPDGAAARPPRRRRPRLRRRPLARLREHGFEVRPGREHWGAPRAHALAPGGHRVELMAGAA